MEENLAMDAPAQLGSVKLQKRLTDIMALTDRYCDTHLDEEYRQLCRDMVAALGREGGPVLTGRAPGWAAGVVYRITWVNFLRDPCQPYFVGARQMAYAVGVCTATLMYRSLEIRKLLRLQRGDPQWCTKGAPGRRPHDWMRESCGVVCYIRQAPLHVPEEAFRLGRIPFVSSEELVSDGVAEAE